MVDAAVVQEIKARLADRYTAAEIVELLGLDAEPIIEEFWDQIQDQLELFEVTNDER